MIRAGETIPDVELRSDEGTPIALPDFKGRGLVVFLLGDAFSPTVERLLRVLAENTKQFMEMNFSPIAALGEPASQLVKFRKQNDVPFLLVSDLSFALHTGLRGDDGEGVAAWIVSDESIVLDVVPTLPPTELVNVVLGRLEKLREDAK